MSTWEDYATALAGTPALPGAACYGLPEPFDPQLENEPAEETSYRHRAAVSICQGCPALTACTAWLESLPRSQRPAGVVAAIAPTPPRRRGAAA